MSTLVCSKQFTLQVPGIRQPTNYWKLLSIAAAKTPASVGAIDLNVGASFTVEAGGIIGPTCFNAGTGAAATCLRSSSGDFAFNSMATGFSLRFWIKCDQPSPSGEDMTDMVVIDGKIFGASIGDYDFQVNSAFTFPNWGAQFYEAVTENNVNAVGPYPIDSSWHRGVIICDKVNKTIKWKLDNGATISATDPAGFFFSVLPHQLFFLPLGLDTSRHMSLSEIGLWQNIILSEAELLVDWNSGNGYTFP